MSVPCFHCHEPVPAAGAATVAFDGVERAVCCPGCEAVMQAIVAAGLGHYYRQRAEPAVLGVLPAALAAELETYRIFDQPEICDDYVSTVDETTRELSLTVENLRCGACVWLLEQSLLSLDGVSQASVNFATHRATVTFDAARVAVAAILGRVAERGFRAMPFATDARATRRQAQSRRAVQRLFVAGIGSMQVMMYALPGYISPSGMVDPVFAALLGWAACTLTVPVLLFSAFPFFAAAWHSLKQRSVGMDVPVSLALAVTFSASVHSLLSGQGETYFDALSMFVFLLLLARHVEWTVRNRAVAATERLNAGLPETAWRVRGEATDPTDGERVPAARLCVGDTVVVGSGDAVPVDAVVVAGSGAVDCAVLTGESLPVAVGEGSEVPGGAVLCGAPLTLRVARVQRESTVSVVSRLAERGAVDKPAWVRLADRVAVYFVAVVLAVSGGVFLVWLAIDADRAAHIAIAVLVVACPCALSLATPAAIAAGTGALLSRRVLATRGRVIHRSPAVTDVVFDKTGTLTRGVPEVVGVDCADGQVEAEVLGLAAAMERGSAHPFAAALRRAAVRGAANVPGSSRLRCEHCIGSGVEAVDAAGTVYRLGAAAWAGLSAASQALTGREGAVQPGASELVLTARDPGSVSPADGRARLLARFRLRDTLQADALEVVSQLRSSGYRLHVLSGDQPTAVRAVAESLGIDQVRAGAAPHDKQAYVGRLQRDGAVVLMVGDGVNDAPVLAAADVSLALNNTTDLARSAADAVALHGGLGSVLTLLRVSARTVRVVRQNLIWAAAYNGLAMPAAAMGWVPPWLAAIGMAASSMLVAGNAWRISRACDAEPADTVPKAAIGKPSWNH